MAVASPWSKPGSWALDSEENESAIPIADPAPSADFPTLAVAAAAKPARKKKPQVLTLAEFNTAPSSRVASSEIFNLPTGPRERSAEELERTGSRGFGGYNGGNGRGPRGGDGEDSLRGFSRVPSDDSRGGGSGSRDFGMSSRADEVDDWGAGKRVNSMPDKRERGSGFFDSQSRADESESWKSTKSVSPLAPAADARKGSVWGFDGTRDDRSSADIWGKRREEPADDTWGKRREDSANDAWGKKREESGRPRLVLQRRTLPLDNESAVEVKPKGANPFGAARPREEVLAEKGQNWREIDEKLESAKMHSMVPLPERSHRRKDNVVGDGNGGVDGDRTERTWRKADATGEAPALGSESAEESVNEN